MASSSYARPKKDAVRTSSFARLVTHPGQPYASILTLPSRQALCVKELARQGLIVQDTHQQWVENDRGRKRFLDFEASAFENVEIAITDLEDYALSRKVDLVNADMESTITARLGAWFQNELRPNFISGGDIVLTVTSHARSNMLHLWLLENIDDSIIADQTQRLRQRMGTHFDPFIIPLALLHCAMQIETVAEITAIAYKDDGHSAMVSVILKNVKPGRSEWPLFTDVAADCDRQKSAKGKHENVSKDAMERIRAELETEFKSVLEIDGQWVVSMSKKAGVTTVVGSYDTLKEVVDTFQIDVDLS